MEHFKHLKDLLFLDLETASALPSMEALDERMQKLWLRKAQRLNQEAAPDKLYFEQAGLYPEFGKIIVLSVGYFHLSDEKELFFRVKSIVAETEKEILEEFKSLVVKKFNQKKLRFVAHNGKEFDFPYLCRRMLINGITLPASLDLYGKRPWQVDHLDTMEMWRFGEFKSYVSLEMLTTLFGLPSSKNEMNGSMVNQVYHQEQDMSRITRYCKEDVVAIARVFLKMKVFPDLPDENIVWV